MWIMCAYVCLDRLKEEEFKKLGAGKIDEQEKEGMMGKLGRY